MRRPQVVGEGDETAMDREDLPTLAHTSLAEATTELLRERIIQGTFAPGERLVEVEIARQLGTSRGPVREALAALRAEGLTRDDPHRGSYVTSLQDRDIIDVYEVRAALETGAAFLVIERNDPETLVALEAALGLMRAAVAAEDRAAFVEADLSLHATLCRGSGNERLYRMSETQTGLLRTLIRLEVERVVHQFEPVMEEHANLVAEIRSGDRMRAAVAVWTLFRRTSRVLIGEPEPAKEMTGKGRSRSATM